jgi:hypothetical protein
MPELASKRADGVIDRSTTRDTPVSSMALYRSLHCLDLSSRKPSWPAFMCECKKRPDIWTQAIGLNHCPDLARRGPSTYGTEPFNLADHISVAGRRGENVEALGARRRSRRTSRALRSKSCPGSAFRPSDHRPSGPTSAMMRETRLGNAISDAVAIPSRSIVGIRVATRLITRRTASMAEGPDATIDSRRKIGFGRSAFANTEASSAPRRTCAPA